MEGRQGKGKEDRKREGWQEKRRIAGKGKEDRKRGRGHGKGKDGRKRVEQVSWIQPNAPYRTSSTTTVCGPRQVKNCPELNLYIFNS